jgi:ubiquinone/menaquinone biosynthesis C-methylase UbiE
MNESELKHRVQAYWDAHPCGTQFTGLEWGSREFFDAVTRERYARQPFMADAVGFTLYRGKRLLEIGCGLGTDLMEFARHGARVTGLDLTHASVALARRRFELESMAGQFAVGDAENMPFSDNSFDVVYSFGVLHHTPDTRRAFGEVHRVLKPGGEAVIMLYHSHSSHLYLGYPLELLARLSKGKAWLNRTEYFRIYDGEDNPLGKAYTRKQVRNLFQGFDIIDQRSYDTFRPRLPAAANRALLLLGKQFGFYLITRARKTASG